ncbi:MAG: poly-beta-hydroxybutyrate polymerase N-terminal domain-containing protein, partial [Gemmobacter sp.]|nr:poly-beta-hydroxybutyrate polymerase N-terminal domain-containing protein [Gemmobacter sp.]
MSRTPKKERSVATGQGAAQLPAVIAPLPARPHDHPHRNLDRAALGAMARLSGGVSTHAFMEAWSDWAQHMSRAPGRQMELAEHAQQNALKLAAQAFGAGTPPPFAPKAYDHRFDHPDWQRMPFQMWQQGFLALQDWWDHATEPMRGLRPEDADRTRFLARQTLDLMSPANFPLLNPEIIAETIKTGGKNLTEGAAHFSHDMLKTLTGQRDPAPEAWQVGKDLACTPGQVVFRNDLFELIQYAPQTKQVQARPILIVPA